MKTKSLVIAVILMMLLAVDIAHPVFAAVSPIKLAGSVPLSGPNSEIGKQYTDSANAYFNLVNNRGGIDQKHIVYNVKDDGYLPFKTVENTISFLNDKSVNHLFGYVGTPTITRVLPLVKKDAEKRIILFPFSGASSFRSARNNPYFLHLRASYSDELEAGISKLLGLGYTRFSVFYQNDAYGRSGWASIRKILDKKGIALVGEATYPRNTTFETPFQPHVKTILAGKPDVVISIGSYQASAGFIRDLRGENTTIPVLNISFVGPENLLGLLQAYSDKTGGDITKYLLQTSVVPLLNSNEPAANHYVQFMSDYLPNAQPTVVGFEGFLAAKYTVYLLQQKQKRGESFRDMALSATPYNIGLSDDLSVEDGKAALGHVYFGTVVKGEYTSVEDWSSWRKK
ncbi:MAG: ABC transporter substrate-binding protein [bacterium]|nr:ABC transporter substrate-binding protein [bacterium]